MEAIVRLLMAECRDTYDSVLTEDEVREIALSVVSSVGSSGTAAQEAKALSPDTGAPVPAGTAANSRTSGDAGASLSSALRAAQTPERPAEDASTQGAESTEAQTGGVSSDGGADSAWPTPVNGGELLTELTSIYRRFVVLPDHAAETLALWTAFTYVLDSGDVSPRLWIHSPERECGKTVVLTLLASLALRALPSSNTTTSAVFRLLANLRPTLLLDEFDNFDVAQRRDLLAILNSGHSHDFAYVLRTDGGKVPQSHSTWGAVAFAGIRGGAIPDTLASRSIRIEMRRKLPTEQVERLRRGSLANELAPVRRRLLRWATDHEELVRTARPEIPAALSDRQSDNWGVLLSIAEVAGPAWCAHAREAALAVCGSDVGLTPSLAVDLLADVKDLLDQSGADRMPSSEMLYGLNNLADRPWRSMRGGRGLDGHVLAGLLREFGIKAATSIRVGDRTPKGYMRASFDEAFRRYLVAGVRIGAGRSASTTSSVGPATGRRAVGGAEVPSGVPDRDVSAGAKSAVTVTTSGCEVPPVRADELDQA